MSAVATATGSDLPAILAIDPMARMDAARRNKIARALEAGRCLVASEGGAIGGFALLHANFFGEAFLELLFIAEAQRRRGLGRALLRHFVALHPGRKTFTSTNCSNAAMQTLLKTEGFIASGTVENLDPGDPELIFCRLP